MTLLLCKDFKIAIKKDIMDIIPTDFNTINSITKTNNKPDDNKSDLIMQIFLKTSA